VAAEIGAGPRSAALDVRRGRLSCTRASEATTRGGAHDLWVSNAGVLITGSSWTQDEPARRTMLEINTLGTMNGTVARTGADDRRRSRRHVINVISLAGIVAAPGEVLTRQQARRHGLHSAPSSTCRAGIRGHRALRSLPRWIWTPMLEDKLDDPDAAGSFSGQPAHTLSRSRPPSAS
jgi:NADP-dependent 3-hydroxy acid dehydrogenase YdfG